jgi:hypothetical protein
LLCLGVYEFYVTRKVVGVFVRFSPLWA